MEPPQLVSRPTWQEGGCRSPFGSWALLKSFEASGGTQSGVAKEARTHPAPSAVG